MNNPIIEEIEKDAAQLKHDFEAHHWLLGLAIVVAIFGGVALWKITDLRNGALQSATITEKLISDSDQLQKQLSALHQELVDLRQSIGNRPAAPQSSENTEPTNIETPAAPTVHQTAPSPKRHR
jgi:hypothetical protein